MKFLPKFDEDSAVEIAYGEDQVNKFEEKYPDCSVMIDRMKPKETEAWIKKNPKANVGSPPPKNLWIVELEEPGKEKLTTIISPTTKKIVDLKISESEALPEDDDDDDEDE